MTRAAGDLRTAAALLPHLARLHGVQTAYTDVGHRRVRASRESIIAVLGALGSPVETVADVPTAFRHRRRELWSRLIEPVVVAGEGRLEDVPLRLPAAWIDEPIRCRLETEDGGVSEWEQRRRGPIPVSDTVDIEGARHVETVVRVRRNVPVGYHRLVVTIGRTRAEALVVAARLRVPRPPGGRAWGVFLPLYALRSERSWGLGDVTDLGELLSWVGTLGGRWVATLPLMAGFPDGVAGSSPYAPASRLFWNEVYADVAAAASGSSAARAELRSTALEEEIRRLNALPLVDYDGAMAAKRRVLEVLAADRFARPGPREEGFRRFAALPRVRDYAAFRAQGERRGRSWRSWPASERDGRLPVEGGDRTAFRTHVFAQWLMERQLDGAAERARAGDTSLYFDVPLGVHPDGYDVWRERDSFVLGASAGSPPDTFFRQGQAWGLPPPHPDAVRATGYAYPIAVARHVMRHAGVVRIDHVMGFHRLYVVPHGADPLHGVYVRYRPEEMYAILSLEAERAGCAVVGEDLGTVPREVRSAMRRHGLLRSHVVELEATLDGRRALPPVPAHSMATLNTHDLPPFAGFWRGADVDLSRRLGSVDPPQASLELAQRRRLAAAISRQLRTEGFLALGAERKGPPLRAALARLAASGAAMVVANLEDLWEETEPQNVPGTTDEYPNWHRPARYRLERFRSDRRVLGTLEMVDRLRRHPREANLGRDRSPRGRKGTSTS